MLVKQLKSWIFLTIDCPFGFCAVRAPPRAHIEDMLERAIGVIYRPETEIASHYFDAAPARQFDAWIWFNETRHVDAHADDPIEGAPETFPFGV